MKYIGEEIYTIIPNRYPYMILDTLEVNEDQAIATIDLKEDLWVFKCHYPGKPILPMTLLIESMTQTFIALLLSRGEIKDEIPVIHSISAICNDLRGGGKISIKEEIKPCDELILVATLNSCRRGIAKGVCRAYKKNEINIPIMEFEVVEVLPSQMVKMK